MVEGHGTILPFLEDLMAEVERIAEIANVAILFLMFVISLLVFTTFFMCGLMH